MSIFGRSELLLGADGIEKLNNSHIAVFGIGGVGSYVVEALVRTAVGELTLVDGDCVAESNINRQLVATLGTIGRPKVEVAGEHCAEINPKARIHTYEVFLTAENIDEFDFSDYDYVVDAIDTVASKLLIIERCKSLSIPVISCMGAGNKLDPTRFEIADISKTEVCPLAKVMRYELRKRGINHLKVLYSKENPIKHGKSENGRPLPGSVAFVPSVAGLVIAGEVIKDIIKK